MGFSSVWLGLCKILLAWDVVTYLLPAGLMLMTIWSVAVETIGVLVRPVVGLSVIFRYLSLL